EIIALMAEGRSNQGICRTLWLSPKTVETHIRGAFAKLGIKESTGGQSPRARRTRLPAAIAMQRAPPVRRASDGAFMEPSGCNQWQSVASGTERRNRKVTPNPLPPAAVGCREEYMVSRGVCGGLPPVAAGPLPVKEGVNLVVRSPRLLLAAALRA